MRTNFWKTVSLATALIGLCLVGYMVVVEGEPGALPLALVLAGTIGVVASVLKARRA